VATPAADDEQYRGQRANIAGRVPPFAQRVLCVGCGDGHAALLLKRAGIPHVAAWEPRESYRKRAAQVLDAAYVDAQGGPYDCIMIQDAAPWAEDYPAFLQQVAQQLDPRGKALWLVDNRDYYGGTAAGALHADEATALTSTAGLPLYKVFYDQEAPPNDATHEQPVELGGVIYPPEDATVRLRRMIRRFLLLLVSSGYDPIGQARELYEQGAADWAYKVLEEIPASYLKQPEVRGAVTHARVLYLTTWVCQQPEAQSWFHVNAIQDLFYEGTADIVDDPVPYRCYAEILRRCGERALALSVLRNYQESYPNEGVAEQIRSIEQGPIPRLPASPVQPDSRFTWPGSLRILYMANPRPHYGVDVLWEGLRVALGDACVDEWPYKPTYHGEQPLQQRNYPCYFDRPGERLSDEDLIERLEAGYYDVVVYADCDCELPRARASRLVAHAGNTPVVLVDALDEFFDARINAYPFLGIEDSAAYFKREMVRYHDYGGNVYPMPFAYAEQFGEHPDWEARDRAFLWAGHRIHGMRRLLLEAVEHAFGWELTEIFHTEEYTRLLGKTGIGLNLFGKGFDTVRYWELPAHGAMLLSPRLPILIPNDFEHGQHAVFFETSGELVELLRHYLAHPEEAREIAQRGHEHWRAHHTAEARARQFLDYLHRALGG